MLSYLYPWMHQDEVKQVEICHEKKSKQDCVTQPITTNALLNVKLRPVVINAHKLQPKQTTFNLYMLNPNQLQEILNIKLRPTSIKEKPQFYPQRCPVMWELLQKTAHRKC